MTDSTAQKLNPGFDEETKRYQKEQQFISDPFVGRPLQN